MNTIAYTKNQGNRIAYTNTPAYDAVPEIGDKAPSIPKNQAVYDDLFEHIQVKDWSLKQYQNHVRNYKVTYKGVSGFLFSATLDAIQMVIDAKKAKKKSSNISEALAFLHLDMEFSPNAIVNIFSMCGIKVSTRQILKASEDAFWMSPPEWIEHITKKSINETQTTLDIHIRSDEL